MFAYPVRSPVFSQTVVHQDQGTEDGSYEPFTPAPGNYIAPENCRDAMPCPIVINHNSFGSRASLSRKTASQNAREATIGNPRGV
jgi:hypothetical protein